MRLRQIWLLYFLIIQVHWFACLKVKGQSATYIEIKIVAHDLSEDMTILSSNDDELLFLMYELNKNESLEPPLLSRRFLMDSAQTEVSFSVKDASFQDNEFLIILIEQDSETPIEQLDPIIRVHHHQLLNSYQDHDLAVIKKYLGDEDLLGISKIDRGILSESTPVQFKGFHRGDSYNYEVSFN